MDIFTTDMDGVTLVNPGPEKRRSVLESVLGAEEVEFPEVYLAGAGGIVLGYSAAGVMTWESGGEVTRVLPGISVDEATRIWNLLAGTDMDALEKLPWRPVDD